jgi:hypothetical protein
MSFSRWFLTFFSFKVHISLYFKAKFFTTSHLNKFPWLICSSGWRATVAEDDASSFTTVTQLSLDREMKIKKIIEIWGLDFLTRDESKDLKVLFLPKMFSRNHGHKICLRKWWRDEMREQGLKDRLDFLFTVTLNLKTHLTSLLFLTLISFVDSSYFWSWLFSASAIKTGKRDTPVSGHLLMRTQTSLTDFMFGSLLPPAKKLYEPSHV